MSDVESVSSQTADPSALLGSLLSNPDLIRNISAILGGGSAQAEGQPPPSAPPASASTNGAVEEGLSRVLANPEMMAKLPDVMKMLAPMVQQTQAAPSLSTLPAKEHGERDRRGCRNDLLIALKPFLSPERCRAIDMLLGLSRLGDALQKMI